MKRETINYNDLYAETKGLLDQTVPLYTNLGNFAALLKHKSNWFWVGFYEVVGQQLILNAFQGPPACVKIPYGKGVCGKSWELETSIIVDNVNEFEGHIACNEASKSEIVKFAEAVVSLSDIERVSKPNKYGSNFFQSLNLDKIFLVECVIA